MGAFTWDKWISLAAILLGFIFKIIWGALRRTHVTDAYADQSILLVHSNLMDKQWRHTDSDQCDIKTTCAIVKMVYMTRNNNFQTSKP